MRFYTDEQWRARHLTEPIQQFAYLRWQELLDERTYLSWQTRTSDLGSICDELRESIDITAHVHSHHPNLLHLIEELAQSLRQSKALREREPALAHVVGALKTAYDCRTRSNDIQDVSHVRSLLQNLSARSRQYKDILLDELAEITTQRVNEKKRLDTVLTSLVALLRNEGYSYFYLRNLSSVFERDESFAARIARLRTLVSGSRGPYTVHFLVKAATPDFPSYESHGAYSVVRREDLLRDSGGNRGEFLSQDQHAVVVAFTSDSLDPYSAISAATSLLNRVVAPARLYRRAKLITQLHDRILVASPAGGYGCYDKGTLRFSDTSGSRSFRSSYENCLHLLSILSDDHRTLLDASLKYFEVAASSTDSEVKFLNLWIALESLYQEPDGESIIGRIRHSLPQIVCSNYVTDLLREAAKDICQYSSDDRFDIIQVDFPNSTTRFISPQELFSVLSDVEDGGRIRRLLEYASNHPLLVHRISQLWETCFRSRQVFVQCLDRHLMNVDWQILRLYRIRNSIMHKGAPRTDVSYLAHHLSHYYHILVHKCVTYLKAHPTHSILDAQLSIREDFEYVREQVKEKQPVAFGQIHTFDPAVRVGPRAWERAPK